MGADRVNVFLDLGLVGGEGAAGLGGDLLLVVVAKLHEQPIAGLHHAEDFVETTAADGVAVGLAGLGVVGDYDLGLEPTRKHLAPTVERFFRLVADRGVAEEEDRRRR